MTSKFSLRPVVAAFVTLALVCTGQSTSAQTTNSLWDCVKAPTAEGSKFDAGAVTVSFRRPAWTVCLANETGEPISYKKRWGPDPLNTHTVYPGQLRAHYCDPGRVECILPFYVEYDALQADPSQSVWTGSPLPTYQQHQACMKCGLAANYAFIHVGNQIILEGR